MAPISTSKQAFNTWFFSKDWLVLENVDETLHGASRHLSIPCITHHSGSTARFCEKAFPLWFKRGIEGILDPHISLTFRDVRHIAKVNVRYPDATKMHVVATHTRLSPQIFEQLASHHPWQKCCPHVDLREKDQTPRVDARQPAVLLAEPAYTFPPSQLDTAFTKQWTKRPTGACTPFRMNSLMSIPRRLAQGCSDPRTKHDFLLVPQASKVCALQSINPPWPSWGSNDYTIDLLHSSITQGLDSIVMTLQRKRRKRKTRKSEKRCWVFQLCDVEKICEYTVWHTEDIMSFNDAWSFNFWGASLFTNILHKDLTAYEESDSTSSNLPPNVRPWGSWQ